MKFFEIAGGETPNNATEEQKTTHAKYREKAVKIVRELAADTKVAILDSWDRKVPENVPAEDPENLGKKWDAITFKQLKEGVSFLPEINIDYLKTGEDNAHLYKIYTDAYAKLDSEAREDANISWQMGLAANAKFKNEVKLDKAENPLAEYIVEQFKAEKKALKALIANANNDFFKALATLKNTDFSDAQKAADSTDVSTITQKYFKQRLRPSTPAQPKTADDKAKKEDKNPTATSYLLKKDGFEYESDKIVFDFTNSKVVPKEFDFKVLSKGGKNQILELNSEAQKFGSAIKIKSTDDDAPKIFGMGLRYDLANASNSQIVKPRLFLPKIETKLQEFSPAITEKVMNHITELGTGAPISFSKLSAAFLEVQNKLVKFANKVFSDSSAITEIDKDAITESTTTSVVATPTENKAVENKAAEIKPATTNQPANDDL